MSDFRYKAFISYSHRDARWANWLHRALETYRLPRRLRGHEGKHGAVPHRIRPVFKDREELTTSHSLSEEIAAALEASEALIVICSPNARGSHWINEEIRLFRRLGRGDHVYCLVVGGEPEALDGPRACFPEALMEGAEQGRREPLASDVRRWADGRQLAKQKLIAGLLGLPLDLLRRREHQRQLRLRVAAGFVAVLLISILYLTATSWRAAENRRDSGETLVTIKLNELRSLLNVQQDPEALARLDSWTPGALTALRNSATTTGDSLLTASLALRDRGIDALTGGELETAHERFRDSWALNALAFRDDSGDSEVYFQLGQAEFWIGRTLYDQGRLEEAEAAFLAYAEITRRLIRDDPENAEWVLEMAYALTNLGFLTRDRVESDPGRTLQVMQSALEYNQIALVLDPGNRLYEGELGESKTNLAYAQLDVCDLEGALQTADESVSEQTRGLQQGNEEFDLRSSLVAALGARSLVFKLLGRNEAAIADLQRSLEIVEALTLEQPDDLIVQESKLDRQSRLMVLQGETGDDAGALERSRALMVAWRSIPDLDQLGLRAQVDFASFLVHVAALERVAGQGETANVRASEALNEVFERLGDAPHDRRVARQIAHALFERSALTGERARDEGSDMLDYLRAPQTPRSCRDADAAFRLALAERRLDAARRHARYLSDSGYRASGYLRLCNAYSVCGDR